MTVLTRALIFSSTLLFLSHFAGAENQTNVILITVDTLRADHVGAYGHASARTPHIDALADEGVLFENALVQTPITLPSHATIFTSTYPFYHGVQDVVGELPAGIPTLTEWFKEKGYTTGAVVGSSVLLAHWGLNRGFDYYEDQFATQGLRQIDFSRVERPAGKVLSIATDWLEANRSKAFFLWIHLYDPHDPYEPPEPFASEFRAQPYDGEVAYIDAELGKFFDQLRGWNLFDSSLLVFTSDHGESLGEHGEQYHAYYIYEASLRIPLIFKLPNDALEGRLQFQPRIMNQVRSIDIAPTIIQLLGHRTPPWAQGEGLLAMMTGRRADVHLPNYAETLYPRIHFGWSSLFSWTTPSHKFIEAPTPELYDLERDPGELNNIYATNSGLANQLKNELHQLQRKFAPTERGTTLSGSTSDPETIERLKALGYVAFSAGDDLSSDNAVLPDPKERIGTYNKLNRAIELSREGNSAEAIEIVKEVAVLEPEMPIVHFMLGSEYLRLEQWDKAAEEFALTLKYNPNSNVARFNLARSYSQSGQTDKAEQMIRELLELEPANFGARHLLASLLAKRGQLPDAIQEELTVLKARPNFVEALNNLGSYYLLLELNDRAAQTYSRAVELSPSSLMLRVNLTLAYLKQQRFTKAHDQAERVVEVAPRFPLGYFYLGQALQGLGRTDEARVAFERAKTLNPNLKVPTLE